MTKVRTLSDLSDAMDAEFAWRKKELHTVKSAVIANEKTANRDTYIRSAVAMLYAHWEGFIKNAGTFYLEFVSQQKLPNNQLSHAMLALSASRIIDDAMASGKVTARARLVEFFTGQLGERCRIRPTVNTRSNLSSKVLREIVEAMGLNYGAFESKEKLIDEKLLENRNKIAHGHYLTVTVAEYSQIHGAVFGMMQEYFDQIYDSASSGGYRQVSRAAAPNH